MSLIVSLLYLLLHIAIILFVVAIIVWVLRAFGWPLDPLVQKMGMLIVALIIVILVVSWLVGSLPPRGLFSMGKLLTAWA